MNLKIIPERNGRSSSGSDDRGEGRRQPKGNVHVALDGLVFVVIYKAYRAEGLYRVI